MAKALTGTARYERITGGVWRDKVTGKKINSTTNPGAGKSTSTTKTDTKKTDSKKKEDTAAKKEAAAEEKAKAEDTKQTEKAKGQVEADVAAGKQFADENLPDSAFKKLTDDYATSHIGQPGTIDKINFSQDTQSIAQLENAYEQAKAGNPYYSDLMGRYMKSLEGFSGTEYQAMREQANRAIDTNTQTAMRTLQKAQGKNAVSGDAAAAQVSQVQQGSNRLKQQTESDIIATAAKEKTARLSDAGAFANQGWAYQQQYSQAALNSLTDARQKQQQMGVDVQIANQKAQEQDVSNKLQADTENAAIDTQNTLNRYNRDTNNNSQDTLLAINRINAQLGYAGVLQGYKNQNITDDMYRKMLTLANRGEP